MKTISEKLRKQAEALTKKIEEKRRPMMQNPTPKRMREYQSRLHDADNLERCQRALRILAEGHDVSDLPNLLKDLRFTRDIQPLVRKGILGGGYYECIPDPDYRDKSPMATAMQNLIDRKGENPEQTKKRQIGLLEAKVQFNDIPGYFSTPASLADRLADLAQIEEGHSVLEPSAGKGNLVEAILRIGKTVTVDAVEPIHALRDILTAKGVNLVEHRIEELPANRMYDRIVMNPPFENLAYCEHILIAWSHLNPGGRLVAIIPGAGLDGDRRKLRELRDAISEEAITYIEKNLPDAFKQSGARVNTEILVLDKAAIAQEEPAKSWMLTETASDDPQLFT